MRKLAVRTGSVLALALSHGCAFAETPADSVERYSNVLILVGVDTDDDVAAVECNACHGC